jgi:type II secretory ATPase GspE/PulE/Tfp pilus assembly ATPase PilB-like protein
VSELLRVTPAVAEAIAGRASQASLAAIAAAEGFEPLDRNGQALVARGIADPSDVERALGVDWDI